MLSLLLNITLCFFCRVHPAFITVLNQLHEIDIPIPYLFNINLVYNLFIKAKNINIVSLQVLRLKFYAHLSFPNA